MATYGPAFGLSTVWDDEFLTTRNPYLGSLVGLWRVLTSDLWIASAKEEPAGYYRPLGSLSLAVDRLVGGNSAGSYHAGNVLLHAAAAVLLLRLGRALLPRRPWLAAALALSFALAPIASEAVCWLSGRYDLLGTIFCLLALLAHVRKKPAAALLAYAAAIFTKEPFLVLPAVLVLDDLVARRRPLGAAAAKTGAYAAVAGLYFVARAAARVPGGTVSGALLSGAALRAYVRCVGLYGATFLRLEGPSIFHVYRDLGAGAAVAGGVVLAAVTALLGRMAWRYPRSGYRAAFLGWLVVLVSLVPVGLSAPRLFQTGDRYAYFAVAGAMLALGGLIDRAACTRPLEGTLATACLVVFAALGVGPLERRIGDWHDEETLFSRELARDPSRYWAEELLGELYARSGRLDEAEPLLRSARAKTSSPWRIDVALCFVYLNTGKPAAAITSCNAALETNPNDPRALTNRGTARLALRDAPGALVDADRAIAVKPHYAKGFYLRAKALYALGRLEEARDAATSALTYEPKLEGARRLLAEIEGEPH